MKRFRVHYRDGNDPAAPEFDTVMRGHDREHVENKFIESNDGDSWEITKVEQIDDEGRPMRGRKGR